MTATSHSAGKRKRRSRLPGPSLWATLTVLALAGVVYAWLEPQGLSGLADGGRLWRKLIWPLLRTLGFVSLGLLAGMLIEGLGWTRRLAVLAGPLTRAAHLPPQAATAFTASFLSGVTANAMLAEAWREGLLDRRQLILANLLNAGLPAYFLHLPTTIFVAYALLGWVALAYFGLTLCAAILRTLGVVAVGRALLSADEEWAGTGTEKAKPWRELCTELARRFFVRLRRLVLIILPVYLVVFLLGQGGFLAWLSQSLAGLVSSRALNLEALSVVVFAVVADFTSGMAAAAALLQGGGVAWQAVVLALLAGNVAATPVRALRHQLPHYMGIYSPVEGGKLLFIGQAARVASVILVALAFYWLA